MSESTEDVQLSTQEEVVTSPVEARAPSVHEHDDVEVVDHSPEPPSAARHDSAVPTSRKLAPPPKPKRDSSNPISVAPPSDPVAAALAAGESLRAIGEALAQESGPFSKTETPSGRPPVPRPRSHPSLNALAARAPSDAGEPRASDAPRARDKLPTVPDSPSSTAARSKKVASVAPQRIISVGGRSDKPPAAPPSPAASPPPPPPELERAQASAPAEHVPTAEPPAVSFEPPPPMAVAAPPPAPEVPPPPLELFPPPPELPPAPPLPVVAAPPVAAAPSVVAAPPVVAAPSESSDAFSVEVHVEEAPQDIPITTDFDEDTPTLPLSISDGFEASLPPSLAAVLIPDEPTPPPPAAAPPPVAVTPQSATTLPSEELAADSDAPERLQVVEELSREDSPSVPPDEPASAEAPAAAGQAPPAPSARSEAKPPPPPRRAPAPPPMEAASEAEKKKSKQKRPWWEELFSEDFVRANWKVSDDQIKREVTFVEESLGVAPGGVVLDLGCGSGQHAVELASRGYGVVGYDLSLYQLALAADNAQERSQKLNFLQGDMREMAFEEMFDGIFCWNTSFGYFEEDKNFSVAERAFRALRPGGMFLIDVMNRDFVAAHTPSSVWFEGDACVCMDDAVIDYFTSRLRVKRSVILDDGRTRECTYSVRLYSFHELGKLLHEVGFRVTEVSGHPATPGVFLGQASPRILMLAQRP